MFYSQRANCNYIHYSAPISNHYFLSNPEGEGVRVCPQLAVVMIVMAFPSHRLSYLLFVITAWFSTAYCYNLDTLVPTVVESGLPPSALFGFSVAQHRFSDGRKMWGMDETCYIVYTNFCSIDCVFFQNVLDLSSIQHELLVDYWCVLSISSIVNVLQWHDRGRSITHIFHM